MADTRSAREAELAAALDCFCIAELKASSCGDVFVQAFSCYVLSDSGAGPSASDVARDANVGQRKGEDCFASFQALQACFSSTYTTKVDYQAFANCEAGRR